MSNFDTLKNELLTQKQKIELKGGSVAVANAYPSPSEITKGIETIETPNFAMSNATVEDVRYGKTFFSGNSELKTGTSLIDPNYVNCIFMCTEGVQSTEDTIYYEIPAGIKRLRPYKFYYNHNPIHITFNPELQYISDYAFYRCINMAFSGFENTVLKSIGENAFYEASIAGFNYASLPDTVTQVGNTAFYKYFDSEFTEFRLPSNLTSPGVSMYGQITRQYANSLDLSNCKVTSLTNYMFAYICFNSDLVLPDTIVSVGYGFNINGCFRNIVIPDGVKLNSYCFGSDSTESVSNFYLQTVTFLGENPGTIGDCVFAIQNLQNGLKIYVPDTAVEEYKAIANLALYDDVIYPMSQKE